MIKKLKAVEIFEIPKNRCMLAVDLKRVERFMPTRISCSFKCCQGSVSEAGQERACVVNADLLHLAGETMLALFDEGFGHGGNTLHRAVKPKRRIDAMRQQVACHSASGHADVEAPQSFAALWKILRNGPILQELRPVVENSAEAAFVDQSFREYNCRHAAIVVPNH